MKKLLSTFVSSLVVTGSLLTGSAMAAGSASLSMSPASATYNAGTTFTASISENSGSDTVNVVEADFSYDASKLQFVSASCGGGFEIAAVANANGITCGTTTAKSGSQSVGSVTFKAIANGTVPVKFTSGSAIYRSTDNSNVWNGNTSAATYTVVTPAAAAPAAPVTPKPVVKAPVKSAVQAAPVATQTETPAATDTSKVLSDSATKKVAATTPVAKTEAKSKAAWIWSGIIVAVLAAAAGAYSMFVRKSAVSAKKPVKRTAKA